MSYDLYFYKRKSNPVAEEKVAEFINELLPFNNSDSPRQWDYENPDTGVHFMIDWNHADPSDSEAELITGAEFQNLHFSLSVNYFRPTYFGYEIFAIVDTLARELNLVIVNYQDQDRTNEPKSYDREHVRKEWSRINDMFIIEKFKEYNIEFFPREKSNNLWWYQFHRNEIEMQITEDLFVPNMLVIKSNEDGLLYTACVWTQHIPTILPPVDFVIIQKKYNKLLGEIIESGIVTYEEIINRFGSYFDDYPGVVPDLKILYQRNANKLAKIFNDMPLMKVYKDFGYIIPIGSFVNVMP